MKLDIQAMCKVGMVRDNNEDMISLGGVLLRDDEMAFPVELNETSQFFLLVADGMGGHEFGERASQGLLEYLNDCFKEKVFEEETFEEDLRVRVRQYNDDLNFRASEEGQWAPMGCTLTGVVWANGKAYLINAGDSRTYRFRNGILRQLTTDETERGITGHMYASKALLNCIGGGAEGRLMVEDLTERLRDGDLLLICSDGLTDMVCDAEIEEVLSQTEQPAYDLYKTASQNGGEDNISVIVARMTMA